MISNEEKRHFTAVRRSALETSLSYLWLPLAVHRRVYSLVAMCTHGMPSDFYAGICVILCS